jgi:membrane associated rhomboid family serine protease
MGLGQDQNNASLAILRRISYWRLPALVIFSSGLIELFGDAGRSFLQFDRAAISMAELWRLISGHFVHLGPNHLLLNAFGLVLVWLLVGMHFTLRQWLIVIVVSIAGIDAGLWFFDPQLTWYVGMGRGYRERVSGGTAGSDGCRRSSSDENHVRTTDRAVTRFRTICGW